MRTPTLLCATLSTLSLSNAFSIPGLKWEREYDDALEPTKRESTIGGVKLGKRCDGDDDGHEGDEGGRLVKYSIQSPDASIKASFVRTGAAVQELFVADKKGVMRDLVLGFDDINDYHLERQYFGTIVGRYANRIHNGTFSIPITENTTNSTKKDAEGKPVKVYDVPNNENDGADALHGGTLGYDFRNWTLADHSDNSVSFELEDPAGEMGFPGNVKATVTYTLENDSTYKISIDATADEETPLLLSSHTWWNLDGYAYTGANSTVVNATGALLDTTSLRIASDRYIVGDSILVPTGEIGKADDNKAFDFRKQRRIAQYFGDLDGVCGTDCTGYDTAFILEDEAVGIDKDPQMTVHNWYSGITLDVTHNQEAMQVFTCDSETLSARARKPSQGGPDQYYGQYSCMVIEAEGWIDAINQPSWKQDQIYGPDKPYKWEAVYKFSVEKD